LVAESFKKVSDLVSFDWDTAYHRAFGEDFRIDYFEGPQSRLEFAKMSDKSADPGPIAVSKNTYLMEYETANETLAALRKIEEKRAYVIN